MQRLLSAFLLAVFVMLAIFTAGCNTTDDVPTPTYSPLNTQVAPANNLPAASTGLPAWIRPDTGLVYDFYYQTKANGQITEEASATVMWFVTQVQGGRYTADLTAFKDDGTSSDMGTFTFPSATADPFAHYSPPSNPTSLFPRNLNLQNLGRTQYPGNAKANYVGATNNAIALQGENADQATIAVFLDGQSGLLLAYTYEDQDKGFVYTFRELKQP